MSPEEKKYTTISIPTPLAKKLKKRIKGTGFNSVSSYVTYILRQVISNIEEEEREKQREKQKEAFTKDDEEKVKQRLKALGYLD